MIDLGNMKAMRMVSIEKNDRIPTLDTILQIMKDSTLKGIDNLQLNAFGTDPQSTPAIYVSPNGTGYVICKMVCLARVAPKELVDRHMESRFRSDSSLKKSKSIKTSLRSDIENELKYTVPPLEITGHAIIIEDGTIYTVTGKKQHLDYIRTCTQEVLKPLDVEFRNAHPILNRELMQVLVRARDFSTFKIKDIVGKRNDKLITIIPDDVDIYSTAINNLEIDRLTAVREDLLYICYSANGSIYSVKPGANFIERWREIGNDEESDMLDGIRVGIWLDEIRELSEIVLREAGGVTPVLVQSCDK